MENLLGIIIQTREEIPYDCMVICLHLRANGINLGPYSFYGETQQPLQCYSDVYYDKLEAVNTSLDLTRLALLDPALIGDVVRLANIQLPNNLHR